METKICLNCNSSFPKSYKISKTQWKERKYCTNKCAMTSPEIRQKISVANKGKLAGNKNPFWRGGIMPIDIAGRKIYKSDYQFLRTYGISAKEKEKQYIKQNGRCAFFEICENFLPANWRKAIQDHDHETGKIRELLCNSCNVAMVGIDNEKWYMKALEYRAKYK